MLLPTNLPISSYTGTPTACGEAYGEEHREGIRIAAETLSPWTPAQLRYAAKCMKAPWRFQRDIDAITRGIARAAGKSYLDIAQFYAHEELGRMKHCTAIAATGPGTPSGKPILGMNWDGPRNTYPWASLLRLQYGRQPATLFYTPYPGLWCGAGMNEHGVSLVWTSADHNLRRRNKWPIVGVPTYALVAGVLNCKTSAEARSLLRTTKNAGGFIFFIADAKGDVMVVEAVPGQTVFIPCKDIIARANHLEDPTLVRRSQQHLPPSTPTTTNSPARGKRVHQLEALHNGRLTPKAIESIFRDEHDHPGLTICQTCANGNNYMTIDSFYCLPAKRELHLARGLPSRHSYTRVRVQQNP
jgi:hypothetical protein